jgi:hypothetical protein
MNRSKNRLAAEELAAINQLRKKPSWRATKRVNKARTMRMQQSETEPLPLEFVVFALIALIVLIGWLLAVG